jgi:trehalose 6-phosphate phosphatase
VITGRPAQIAVDYASLADVDRLVVLGHYGLERWEGGRVTAPCGRPRTSRRRGPGCLRCSPSWAWRTPTSRTKGGRSLCMCRRAADPLAAFDLVAPRLRALADELGLAVEPGRMVVELRPAGGDKGAVMSARGRADAFGGRVHRRRPR